MYVGHFALGLALKARFPKVPAVPLLIGVGFLDIVNGLFVMLGLDRVTPDPSAGPYLFFDLTFIDWDHSLAAALMWSALWAWFFRTDRRVAALAFVAAFSHFPADWLMHNGDLALFPYAETRLGLGLWERLGTASWLLEGAFAAALCAYAWRANARRGIDWTWPCAAMGVLFLNLSPWLTPMKFVATLNEPAAHLLAGGLVAVGFLLPALVVIRLIERAALRSAPGRS